MRINKLLNLLLSLKKRKKKNLKGKKKKNPGFYKSIEMTYSKE